MVKPPDPIRTLKLSTIGPAQYCGGGPRGNRRWCTFLLHHCTIITLAFIQRVAHTGDIWGFESFDVTFPPIV